MNATAMRSTALVFMLLSWAACRAAAEPPVAEESLRLEVDLPYQAQRSKPVNYQADFSAVVTAPYGTKLLKVWLPLPPSDGVQVVSDSKLTSFPVEVPARIGKETTFGNRFAYFEFHNPKGAQIIRHQFQARVWQLHWNVEPDKIVTVERWPAQFDPYLRGDRAVVVDERFSKLLERVLAGRPDELHPLAAIMAWTNGHMTYDHARASLSASSEHALEQQRGHCSDYHGLCAAMGRALGYPTRVTYGMNLFAKNSPSHCKLEAFLPPYGWVSFDVSETQRLVAAIEQGVELEQARERLVRAANQRLYSGFRDNTWLLLTKGTDYDLDPPAAQRVAVVRTIHAEADGVALPEPDPANPDQREFAWMTVHKFTPDRPVKYPFDDWRDLPDQPNDIAD
ncbi:MAG: transglutaminase domain-containing protein [Pirellulales bacterium]